MQTELIKLKVKHPLLLEESQLSNKKDQLNLNLLALIKEIKTQISIHSKSTIIARFKYLLEHRIPKFSRNTTYEDLSTSKVDWTTKLYTKKSLKNILSILIEHTKTTPNYEAMANSVLTFITEATKKKSQPIPSLLEHYKLQVTKLKERDLQIKDEENKNLMASKKHSKVIKEAFIKACLQLDASIFEPLIKEDQYFQDLDKYRFLQSLKDEFDTWKTQGFTKTTLINGHCQGCHCGDLVYQFYTNSLTPAFAYRIHENNGEIEDIFMCNLSSGMKTIEMGVLMKYAFWR
ncbi:hypothetical protein [Bizionia paragorgiae]|uniref:hypothetical protein n=1 Tax=Bizionia paragorgiae TaxID=283786 RepID=UPI00299F28E8|nr:hypothetical protein [Bizionia paragorgiae]MDX1270822.1 hypothetical protein [Bizionia paragorgiae]